MQVQPFKFTNTGQIGKAAFTASNISGATGKPFGVAYGDVDGSYNVPAQGQRVTGFAYNGFTKVVAYNGSDNTGDVVFVGAGAGTYSFNYEVNCNNGLYVEVSGTGSGTVWLA